jgi:hypothetical protein
MHHTQFTCGLYQPSSLTTDRKLKEVWDMEGFYVQVEYK